MWMSEHKYNSPKSNDWNCDCGCYNPQDEEYCWNCDCDINGEEMESLNENN